MVHCYQAIDFARTFDAQKVKRMIEEYKAPLKESENIPLKNKVSINLEQEAPSQNADALNKESKSLPLTINLTLPMRKLPILYLRL